MAKENTFYYDIRRLNTFYFIRDMGQYLQSSEHKSLLPGCCVVGVFVGVVVGVVVGVLVGVVVGVVVGAQQLQRAK